MQKHLLNILLLLSFTFCSYAQGNAQEDTINKKSMNDPSVLHNITSTTDNTRTNTDSLGWTATAAGPVAVARICSDCACLFSPFGITFSFMESLQKKYGYDDYGVNATHPWVSVKTTDVENVGALISPPAGAAINFISSAPTGVTVDATATHVGSSTAFDIKIHGVTDKATSIISVNKIAGIVVQRVCNFNAIAYNVVNKTVAVRVVNSRAHIGYAGYTSTPVAKTTIETFLKKCYSQAVVNWSVDTLPTMTIDFDHNSDGKIETPTSVSSEMQTVIDSCSDARFDQIVFLIDNSSDGSTGNSGNGSKWSFVHVNESNEPANTIAHELGHATFKLPDLNAGDTDNIMNGYIIPNSAARLRKDQWIIIHL